MKRLLALLLVTLIVLLASAPLFAQEDSKEIGSFDSSSPPKQGDPKSGYLRACYYQEQGKHRKAIEEFKEILLIDSRNVKVLNRMGVSYDVLGDFPKAMESYEKALEIRDDLDYVQNNRGYSYLLQGNPDDAIFCFKRAIALNGRDGRFHNNLGLAYATKGQMDLALAEFKLAGDESKAYYYIAQFYSRRRSYQGGQRHYAGVLTVNSSDTRVRESLEPLEAFAKSSQPEAHKAEFNDMNSSSPLPLGELNIKEEMLPSPPEILESNDKQQSEKETRLAGYSGKEPPDIGELTSGSEEAIPILEEAGARREGPAIDYMTVRGKSIGQRALELYNTEPAEEILEILRKEYGEEQLDQWLGISRGM